MFDAALQQSMVRPGGGQVNEWGQRSRRAVAADVPEIG